MAAAATANVNRPTVAKERDADINRKLQIYGIVNAFQIGKVPSVSLAAVLLLASPSGL